MKNGSVRREKKKLENSLEMVDTNSLLINAVDLDAIGWKKNVTLVKIPRQHELHLDDGFENC
jgi:hypothetical protein